MVYATRKFTFSAGHRYWRPEWSAEENARVFGSLTVAHGHNYTLDVTVRGEIDPRTGMVMDLGELKRVVGEAVIRRFDHADLNQDPLFPAGTIPTTENLVRVIKGGGAKPLIMTFPYCEEITGFFGVPGFKEAVDEHNRLLREIAEREGAEFYDLAAVFPKDKKFWAFDGIHMSAEGAALEAKMVADFLMSRGLVP